MERIDIYKITFDFDDGGYNVYSEAVEHVTASSESRAKTALKDYIHDMYGDDAYVVGIHNIEKVPLIDGKVLNNKTHLMD